MSQADSFGESRRSRFLFGSLLALVFGFVSIQYAVKVLKPRPDGYTQSAVLRWSKQLQGMEDGENIHAKYNYPNPPIMAQMLWPISELAVVSPLAGAMSWFYLKVLMAVVSILWVFRMVEGDGNRLPLWVKALVVAVSIRPILGDLTHGNINIFILFLVVGSVRAFTIGRDTLSGLLLALAIACKVTPALLLVYFLWKRSGRVLLGAALGLLLFFGVIPALVFAAQDGSLSAGWDRNLTALLSWFNGMVLPYVRDGFVTPEHQNQSLPGLLTRLLTVAPSFTTWIEGVYTPLAYHNVADLSPATVKLIVQGCQLAFLAAMVWVCRSAVRTDGTSRSSSAVAAECALMMIGMLLFSERTWKHHCVVLLLPMAVLGSAAYHHPGRIRVLAVAALILSTLAMSATSTGSIRSTAELVNSTGKLAQVYGAYTLAFLILGTALTAMLWMVRKHPPVRLPDFPKSAATAVSTVEQPTEAATSA